MKKLKRASICLMFFLFLLLVNVKAQNNYQVQANFSDITGKELANSPNPAAFTQYGKVPVSGFTGTANIKIPLYDIKVDNFDLPVYLTYDSQGVRPNNHAGWVGTGWSLFAGSAITRKVNGAPDEFVAAYAYGADPTDYPQGHHLGWYYHSKVDKNNLTNNNSNWAANLGNAYPGALSLDGAALEDDYAPDEFDFNINDISGAFFMGEDGNWKVRSNNGTTITVQEVMANGSYTFKPFPNGTTSTLKSNTFVEFIITTGDGTQYYFGDDPNGNGSNAAIEFNRAGLYYAYNVEVIPNAWHITKIVLPSKKVITFQYKRDGVVYQYSPGYSDGVYSMETTGSVVIYANQSAPDVNDASVNIVDPVYLQSITFPEGSLKFNSQRSYEPDLLDGELANFNINTTGNGVVSVFGQKIASSIYAAYPELQPPSGDPLANVPKTNQNPPSCWYQLNDVELDDNLNNKLKDFKFSYSWGNTNNTRLFLNSIQEYGYYNNVVGTALPPYVFSYNTTLLPNYGSYNVDHWGFYNGLQSLPDVTNFSTGPTAYNTFRTPSLTYAQAGILTQITYPSGGITAFQYELNRYKSWVGNLPISLTSVSETAAGGLRVKSVVSTDNITGQSISYTYDYVNDLTNNVSSGILGSPLPTYFVIQPSLTLTNQPGFSGINQFLVAYQYFSCNSIYPAHNSDGAIVTYSNVIERQFNNGVYNGMKTTVFSNHDNGYMDNSPDDFNYVAPTDGLLTYYSDRSFERGLVLSELYFNGTGLPVKTVVNSYNSDPNRFNTFVKSILPGVKIVPVSAYSYHFWRMSAIRNYTYYPYLQQTVETDYPSDNSTNTVATTKNYTYDSVNGTRNMVESVTTDSKGQLEANLIKYPLDYNLMGITPSDAFTIGVANLQNLNALSIPVESTKQLTNADGTNLRTTASSLLSFDASFPFQKIKYVANLPAIPAASFIPSSVTSSGTLTKDGSYDARIYIDNYDGTGNPLQEHIASGANQAYQWGYNNSYLVAVVKNAANSITTVTSNGYGTIGISIPASSSQSYSQTINVGYSGSTTISYAISGDAAGITNPNATASIAVTGPSYSNTFYLSTSGSSYPITQTLTGLTPGTYTIKATCVQTLAATTFVNGSYPAVVSNQSGIKEFYYEGFEESTVAGVTSGTAHTGHNYFVGTTFTPGWTPPNPTTRTYVISYWYLSAGVWQYKAPSSYTGATMAITGGTAYDDVRIYPSDAQMTTYTYDYLVGITSATDAKGETTYYEYDPHERLMNIRDKDGNIIKHIDYHYQGQ